MYSQEFFDRTAYQLSSALICDILDDLGYRNQAMDGSIAPVGEGRSLFGTAKTMLAYDVFELPEKPYEKEIEAVDSIRHGDVAIVCTNGSSGNGFWGELMATASVARGGRGAIIDGAVRDIRQLRQMEDVFAVYAAGRNPLDSRGRCLVADYDCPVMCGGVMVYPGDMVFADVDGIVAIPGDTARTVIQNACAKAEEENTVRQELKKGRLLKDVFTEYGVL